MRRKLAALALLALSACAHEGAMGAGAPEARFDWFQYEGRDSVYDELARGPNDYLNPILAGFYPDPSITRVGEDYYLVNSTFAYFPGIPVFHSRDLVNWTQIGNVIDRPSQLNFDGLGISRGVFAPAIEHHDGVFYVLNTCVDCGGNYVVTATNPAGPWSDPVWLEGVTGIDPSLFFDEDGKAYIVNNDAPIGEPLYDGHRALWLQEFDPAAKRMVGPRTMIVNGGVDISQRPIWIEGPHIFRHDGAYFLIAAEGGTEEGHSEVVFRSTSVRGPWAPYPGNPILTQRHLRADRNYPVASTGHADFVETQTGEWWAVFLATRPYGRLPDGRDLYNTGRETFLMPVRWEGGWPVIAAGAETVPYAHRAPDLPTQSPPPVPLNGNFVLRDEFDAPELAPQWLFIRTPRERWYELAGGALTLRARADHIGRRQQPSFVGRRQQHLFASAVTALRFSPTRAGDEAGLVAFQNDDVYFFLGLAREGERTVVQVKRRAGAGESADGAIVASAPIALPRNAPLYLKIDARGARYDFHYAIRPDEWVPLLLDADATILSSRTAGGFVGALFGLYAHGEPR